MLVDKFGLRPWEIARLTDRQIAEVYFHARDEHGALVAPSRTPDKSEFGTRYDPPESLGAELKALGELNEVIRGQNKRGLTNYPEAVELIKAKWADGSRQKQRAEWEVEQKRKQVTDGQ